MQEPERRRKLTNTSDERGFAVGSHGAHGMRNAVIVPGSKKKGEVWTEVEELRVTLRK